MDKGILDQFHCGFCGQKKFVREKFEAKIISEYFSNTKIRLQLSPPDKLQGALKVGAFIYSKDQTCLLNGLVVHQNGVIFVNGLPMKINMCNLCHQSIKDPSTASKSQTTTESFLDIEANSNTGIEDDSMSDAKLVEE